jgi:DNA replication and repair protein RecF
LANQEDLTRPILLLDDIFDKFDENRTASLMAYILSEKVGQVFITDANDTRMKKILASFDESLKHIKVANGCIIDE